MASGTLYTYPENFRAYKALIAAQYSGSNVKLAPGFVFGETNKSKEFLKKFPLGKVPAFETSDGQYLTESNAIAYYVSNKELQGKTDIEKAQILQWLGFADSEILPASCTWVFPCLGIMQYSKQSTERAKDDVKAALNTLNTHLLTRTYLVGERISLADIGVACTLLHLYQYVLGPAFSAVGDCKVKFAMCKSKGHSAPCYAPRPMALPHAQFWDVGNCYKFMYTSASHTTYFSGLYS